MKAKRWGTAALLIVVMLAPRILRGSGSHDQLKPEFHTSDRCLACHNGLHTREGKDISIGIDWRSSIMANSSRDPYWQASVRRETLDHPQSKADVENECSICHMPIVHYEDRLANKKTDILDRLPFNTEKKQNAEAEDGVSCSLCHQIGTERLGTSQSFNGQFIIDNPKSKEERPEYGPFTITQAHKRIMQSSTGGFVPQEAAHIRDSALCGSCHTLYTSVLGSGTKEIGKFPEQMPYLEWLHSDYPKKQTCQSCHMPEVNEPVAVTAILGEPREGMHQHVFRGGNFFMQRMLNQYRGELSVIVLPQELSTAADGTIEFLQTQSARVRIQDVKTVGGKLQADILVENFTGHKLPTAYPSRRAWLHVVVTERNGKKVFESGALNPDGSIQGNDNDADPTKFEPHYREITSADQVQIFEPILQDEKGQVTTGLLHALRYFKDNRLLPSGFDKTTADPDIAVVGGAAQDPNFKAGGDLVRYSVALNGAQGPFHIQAELWYQPIGFRWAHNLEPYQAFEPKRFVQYYDSMSSGTAVVLASAGATHE